MVSSRDVAEAAGVSVSTVSRALSHPERVAPHTREVIVAAARELGYHPNAAARELRTGRSGVLGLVVPDLENPFFASVTKAVQARARSTQRVVVVVDTDEDPAAEAAVIAALVQHVDGLLLCSPRADDQTVIGAIAAIPAVVLNRLVGGLPSLAADDAVGAEQALGHLRVLGHRRVAVALGPVNSWSGVHRLAGLHAASERFGDVDVIELGHFPPYFTGGFAAADHLIASGATAVITFNDMMAVGLLARLRDRGVGVPDDVSVVGYDDIAVATLVAPPLTTVAVPRDAMARRGVDLLVSLLDQRTAAPPAPASSLLPEELIIRDSTAEPPTPAPISGEPVGHHAART